MMYESWFAHLREEDDDLATLEEQQALLDFLNDKTSANEAARYYTSVVTKSDDPNGMYIWSLLYTVARNLPQTQDMLIELLQGIQRLSDLERNGKVETAFGEKFWSGLPGFAIGLREIWDGLLSTITDSRHTSLTTELINLTAFNARILGHGIIPLEHWAAQTFRIVLEEDYTDRETQLDSLVPAAAQYILYAGEAIFRCKDEMSVPQGQENFTYAGPLWKGRQGLSKERWSFWKMRFEDVSKLDSVEDGTKKVATRAVDAMQRVEGGG